MKQRTRLSLVKSDWQYWPPVFYATFSACMDLETLIFKTGSLQGKFQFRAYSHTKKYNYLHRKGAVGNVIVQCIYIVVLRHLIQNICIVHCNLWMQNKVLFFVRSTLPIIQNFVFANGWKCKSVIFLSWIVSLQFTFKIDFLAKLNKIWNMQNMTAFYIRFSPVCNGSSTISSGGCLWALSDVLDGCPCALRLFWLWRCIESIFAGPFPLPVLAGPFPSTKYPIESCVRWTTTAVLWLVLFLPIEP